jgi:hypothetical protein
MIENFRHFEAGPDPFGRVWQVEFRWLQTAISIRHSDSVDVKFQLSQGEEVQEKVVALMLPDLMALAKRADRAVSDAWCLKLAGLYLKYMIESDKDMDKTLVTAPLADLERAEDLLSAPALVRR